MKQLLFLLLFPCFAIAQYQGNGNQKITLGEQTTADGLVWRGRLADTANLLTNKLDTSVYIVLDTGTRAMWYYRASTTPKWTRLVDSLNNLQGQLSLTSKVTGVLPVANGGTGQTTLAAASIITGSGNSNKIPKFNGTNSLTDSKLNDDATTLTYTGIEIVAGINSSNDAFFTMNASQNNYLQFKDAGGGSGAINYNHTNDYLTFKVNGSNRLTIKSDGNVGIGTESPQSGYRLHVVDSVYVGGNVSASAYTTRSDYELKDEIQNISYGINEVMQMQPVKYTYKSNGSTQLGFIAQDLGVITPEVVSFEDKMSVYYNALIPILTKAIQEQTIIIKQLEDRIKKLEEK